MGVTLERVQFKFASIIGELCSEPDILSQFAVWVDLRLAEYKLKGSISLDCSGESPDPVWLKGIKSAILEKALSLRNASGGDLGRVGPVRSPKPHIASRSANSARDSRGPSTPSVEQRLSPVVIKEEPSDVFPVSIHRSKLDSRKRPISDTESGDRDVLNSMGSPSKQSRLEANPENESLMSIIGMDNADDETPEIAEVSQENIAREIDYLISQNAGEKAELETTQMSGDSSYASAFPSTSSQGANNNVGVRGPQHATIGRLQIPNQAKERAFGNTTQKTGLSRTIGDSQFTANEQLLTEKRSKFRKIQTKCYVKKFENWLAHYYAEESRSIEAIPPPELDRYLVGFFRALISPQLGWAVHSYNSLRAIRSGLERHLRESNYPQSITSSFVFSQSQMTFRDLRHKMQAAKSLSDG